MPHAPKKISAAVHETGASLAARVAERFLDEIALALTCITEYPGTESPRYASITQIESLRFWILNKFPFAIFYIERTDAVDVLRVLHQAADLPQQLT